MDRWRDILRLILCGLLVFCAFCLEKKIPETPERVVEAEIDENTEKAVMEETVKSAVLVRTAKMAEIEETEETQKGSAEILRESYTEDDVECLAIAIYQEAGGNANSDECRRMVADVVLNRVADSRYPDTIRGVLTQKAQYGRLCWTGIKWPERSSHAGEQEAVERARELARGVLEGDHSILYGEGYVYQAEFEQGKEGMWFEGFWFGR